MYRLLFGIGLQPSTRCTIREKKKKQPKKIREMTRTYQSGHNDRQAYSRSVQRVCQESYFAIASGTLTYTFVLLSACYCTGHEAELQASDGLNGTWYCTKHTYNGGNIYCLLFGIRI